MKIVVYTTIIGGIDRLWSIVPGHEDVPHVAFVDAKKREVGLWGGDSPSILQSTQELTSLPKSWEQRVVERKWGARRTARHYKTLPHRYLPDADVWIWVDGNVRLRTHPREVVKRYLQDDFSTLRHPDRDCAYVEAAFCAKKNKDKRAVLEAQAARYRKAGLPERWGLAETRVVVRRNTVAIRELNEAWWREVEHRSVRDQVALPFVCWQAGMRWGELPGRCWPKNKSKDWYYVRHKA